MSKKHERNLRYLARAEAYARIAVEALHQAGVSISQLEIGPSAATAVAAYDDANHRMRKLEAELGKLERLVCS
jgi:phage terminase small subunit